MFRLVPNTGIQFVDFDFNSNDLKSKRFSVIEDENIVRFSTLLLDDEGENYIDGSGNIIADDIQMSGSVKDAMAQFAGQWLPMPFFRNGREGPVNWVRIYFPKEQKSSHTRVVLAFDTTLAEHDLKRELKDEDRTRLSSLMPTKADVTTGETVFSLPNEFDLIGSFFEQKWVGDWVRKSWKRPDGINAENERLRSRKALANYLAMLMSFSESKFIDFPRVKFIDNTEESTHQPIDVDFVLDIGNSRTFGLLVEAIDGSGTVKLSNSYPVELKDISQPDLNHDRPFESRVEFCKPFFGPANLSRLTGRRAAFHWPSGVRIGDEAVRLSHEFSDTKGISGMTSPKRYLWSSDPVDVEWHFNSGGRGADGSLWADDQKNFEANPLDTGGYFKSFAMNGDALADSEDALPAVTARFSRSSLMTFFLVELLLQVLREINSPQRRQKQGQELQARRLRRIVLTMPTAMTRPERAILKRRMNAAIREVWDTLGMAKSTIPKLQMQWDESSATQAVFVYNEIVERFFGDIESFMHAISRPNAGQSKPMRLVSLDIGGGTSDLIITSYQNVKGSLNPSQEFREGFQCAGDDIVKGVIEAHIIPSLMEFLDSQNVTEARNFIVSKLGAPRAGEHATWAIRRQQFCQQVLIPMAYWLLEAHEGADRFSDELSLEVSWTEIFADRAPMQEVVDYLAWAPTGSGDERIDMSKLSFSVSATNLIHTVTKVMEPFIDCLAEVTHYYDCDFMLLSGRPSRFPALRAMIAQRMPVTPERIVTMHDYEVGSWYPFRNLKEEIGDPKTCAAVGAMICALSEGQLDDFYMRTSQLQMRSTARFIGQMNQMRIREDQVLFKDVEMEQDDQDIGQAMFRCNPPTSLGFRQLDLDRWPATMLYRVVLSKSNVEKTPPKAIDLTLSRIDAEEDPLEKLFRIESLADGEGEDLPVGLLKMGLQTMLTSDIYWADSGSFNLAGIE